MVGHFHGPRDTGRHAQHQTTWRTCHCTLNEFIARSPAVRFCHATGRFSRGMYAPTWQPSPAILIFSCSGQRPGSGYGNGMTNDSLPRFAVYTGTTFYRPVTVIPLEFGEKRSTCISRHDFPNTGTLKIHERLKTRTFKGGRLLELFSRFHRTLRSQCYVKERI